MNRIIKILIPILIITILLINYRFIKSSLGYNSNQLNVTVESPLKSNLITIATGFFSINRESDRMLFNSKVDIVYKGKELKQIRNDYGENDFLIKYADTCYYEFRHFKTNNKQRDSYCFHFVLRHNKIFIIAEILGTDPMKFEREFHLIKDADKLRCNSSIKESGHIYNMLELKKNN